MLETVHESRCSFLTSAELWFFTGFGACSGFQEYKAVTSWIIFQKCSGCFPGEKVLSLGHCFGDISLTLTCSRSLPHHLSWALKTSLSKIPTAPTTNSCPPMDYLHFIFLPTYLSFFLKKIHCLKTHSGVSQSFLTITLVFIRAESHPTGCVTHWQKAEADLGYGAVVSKPGRA